MDDKIFALWLSFVDGIGNAKHAALMDYFKSARRVYEAPRGKLREVPGISERNAEAIIGQKDLTGAENLAEKLNKSGIKYFCNTDREYPSLLKEIHSPPAVLYVLGDMPDDMSAKVGVIGTRRCSRYGVEVTRRICGGLAKQNVVVVSGMARGIDSAAHCAAMDAGGFTIAVLGCGVDICYPAESAEIRGRIIRQGCVISEYPPGTEPNRGLFPERNRIISGISLAIVVTEASSKSGTMITVAHALDQGRDVMAVPGNITSALSSGSNGLIREGAELITSYEDIMHTLNLSGRENIAPNEIDLAPDEKVVYDMLDFTPLTFDEIADRTHMEAQTVNYIITMLELKGAARKMPGQRYARQQRPV